MRLPSIKKAVSDCNRKKEEAQYHERWANRLSTGYTIRNVKPVKLEPFDTFGVVTLEEYHGGKVVARESMILNSTNWGGTKI